MAFSIRQGKLYRDSKSVEFMRSPFTSGPFLLAPKILVVHFTYGSTGRSSAEWFRSAQNPGSSAHLVCDRDGSVIQCVDFADRAWHAGASTWHGLNGLNNYAYGLELANWGYLRRSGMGWMSYTGAAISDPILAIHKNGNPDGSNTPIGWEQYPESQFLTAVEIARALVAEYGVTEIVGHDDIAPTRKWDPGPAFDMMRFKARVFGDRAVDAGAVRTVGVAEGLNLRSGPAISYEVVKLLPLGTLVAPIEQGGNWLLVSVLRNDGSPKITGWINQNYLM